MFLNYGHLLIMYIAMSSTRRPDGSPGFGLKTILGIGVCFIWMFVAKEFTIKRVALEANSVEIYRSDIIIPDLIINQINDFDDVAAFGLGEAAPDAQDAFAEEEIF